MKIFSYFLIAFFSISLISSQNVTKEQAAEQIKISEEIINELANKGFPIIYVNDTFYEAKRIFEQAKYAEILRNENSTSSEKYLASQKLNLISWKNIYYNNVLIYTDEIKSRNEKTIFLFDLINFYGEVINSNPSEISFSSSREKLTEANISFYNERFDETEILIEELDLILEEEKKQSATLEIVRKEAQTFLYNYWPFISIFFMFMFILIYVFSILYKRRSLGKKFNRLNAEKKALNKLIKCAQKDRFEKNSISSLVYNIRLNEYKDRLQKIEEELPLVFSELKKLKKSNK